MSFRRMEYFLAVAKHLNFTKAARECYVAQAAISQQVKQFEEELGFKLLDRGGASVKLTPAGAYFARQCRSILALYNGAVKQARAIADGEKRVLRVGFHGLSAQKIFAGHLRRKRFQTVHSRIIAVDVVADRGLRHRPAHLSGGLRYGVAPEINRFHALLCLPFLTLVNMLIFFTFICILLPIKIVFKR